MSRDRIFLIEPGFEDSAFPGRSFFCPYCNQIEGVLASNPDLADSVDVVRVPFARPRAPVVALLGESNQSLPVLVVGEGQKSIDGAKSNGPHHFIDDTTHILERLATVYGVPHPHP